MWTVVATAYIAACLGCSGVTASGKPADHRQHYIAASPHWKLGTCVELELAAGKWTRYTVQDRGPKDRLHFDILVPTKAAATKWGRQTIRARPCKKK